jgi:acyl-CoA thioesterase II
MTRRWWTSRPDGGRRRHPADRCRSGSRIAYLRVAVVYAALVTVPHAAPNIARCQRFRPVRVAFADLLQLESMGHDRFVVTSEGSGFLFGGLTLAVALRAAAETIDEGKVPMSLRATFLAGGEWGGPHHVTVQRVNDTRNFSLRRIDVVNSGRLVVAADALFHQVESGDDRAEVPPLKLAAPEDLTGAQLRAAVDVAEVRPTPAPPRLLEPEHPFWCRIHDLPDDPIMEACGLAFVSDYWVIATPFMLGERTGERLLSRTLEHALWFHRPNAGDGWWYVDCDPLSLAGGRYTSRGTLQGRDGTLLASFVQEGFVRPN